MGRLEWAANLDDLFRGKRIYWPNYCGYSISVSPCVGDALGTFVYPKKVPLVMRVAALVQIEILIIIGVVVSARGGIIFPE